MQPRLRAWAGAGGSSLMLVVLAACTSHKVPIASGNYEVQFSGGRLDRPPVTTAIVKEGGYEFVTDLSAFEYEHDDAFRNVQVVAALREKHGWALHVEDAALESMLAVAVRAASNTEAGSGFTFECAKAVRVTPNELQSEDLSGFAARCDVSKGEHRQTLVLRALKSSSAVIFQGTSWTSAKGKAWSASFLRSLRRSGSSAVSSGPPVLVSAALLDAAGGRFAH